MADLFAPGKGVGQKKGKSCNSEGVRRAPPLWGTYPKANGDGRLEKKCC